MKRKLIFITRALWVGGIESALVNLLRALDEDKYELTCLILQDRRELAHRLPEHCRLLVADRAEAGYLWLRDLSEEPTAPSRRHRALSWLRPLLRWADDRVYLRYLRRTLAGQKFDAAVIYHQGAALAAKALRAEKFLLFYHHGAVEKILRGRWICKKCGKIVTVSHYQATELARLYPKYAQKILSIHNLTDGDWVRKQARAFSPEFAPGQFHIFTCGRLHRDKGMDLAVEACGKLACREDWHWWIIGGGPEEADLRRRIAESGLEEKITLLGKQENPYPYMAACDLYVQPSRVEGYPMSILEARILGKPILSTDNPGGREALGDGKWGLLCPATPEGIAAGIQTFLRERPEFPALAEREENQKILHQLEEIL